MKRLATTMVAAMGFFSASAYAADLRAPVYKAPPLLSSESAVNWTGFYVGINAGYLGGTVHASNVTPAGNFLPDVGVETPMFGFQAGYRYEMPNNFVVGLQVNVPLVLRKQSPLTFGKLNEGEVRGAAIFQGQLGYAVGRFMPYLTGGIGFMSARARQTVLGGPTSPWASNTHTVGTLGFGVNYAITQNWTTGLVYNHLFTSNETYNCGPICGVVGTFGLRGETFEALAEYKF